MFYPGIGVPAVNGSYRDTTNTNRESRVYQELNRRAAYREAFDLESWLADAARHAGSRRGGAPSSPGPSGRRGERGPRVPGLFAPRTGRLPTLAHPAGAARLKLLEIPPGPPVLDTT